MNHLSSVHEILGAFTNDKKVSLDYLLEKSKQLLAETNGQTDARAVIRILATMGFELRLSGDYLEPHPVSSESLVVPPQRFADFMLQLQSYMFESSLNQTFTVYVPSLDKNSGYKELLMRKGVWLRRSNSFVFALMYRDRIDVADWPCDKYMNRTSTLLPVIAYDEERRAIGDVKLLNIRATPILDFGVPFIRLRKERGSLFAVSNTPLPSIEMMGDIREKATAFLPTFEGISELFDPKNNVYSYEDADHLMALLVFAQIAAQGLREGKHR